MNRSSGMNANEWSVCSRGKEAVPCEHWKGSSVAIEFACVLFLVLKRAFGPVGLAVSVVFRLISGALVYSRLQISPAFGSKHNRLTCLTSSGIGVS